MYKLVNIARADGSDEPTALLANAATPRRYKQIFHEDLLTLFANAEKTDDNGSKNYQIDFLSELAFVMAMQAKAAGGDKSIRFEKLNENSLIDWLEEYDGMAIEDAAADIVDVYIGNSETTSDVKKNRGKQNGK